MTTITAAQRDAVMATIRRVTDRWDEPLDEVHDLPPIVDALIADGHITVSDEPEAPDDVIERARATVERSMGRAWTDEGEYANLPQQAAHDLATAGLLRTGS